MPKLYKGKLGGLYYKKKGNKVYITNLFGNKNINLLKKYLPNSLYGDKNLSVDIDIKKIEEVLDHESKKIIKYFTTTNEEQPKAFWLDKNYECYLSEIPENYDNKPVLIFDLDKTIDDDCISPLYHDIVKKFPEHIYVVTARPDYYMYCSENFYNCSSKRSKEQEINDIIYYKTQEAFDNQLKNVSNVYCRNFIFQHIAKKLHKKIHKNKKKYLIPGYVKMIQLLHIKSSIGCKWEDMYFFDDSSYNLEAWKNLKNINELNFIGGENKCVFKNNMKTHNEIKNNLLKKFFIKSSCVQ